MKRHAVLLMACALAWTPRAARADEVLLKGGGSIENVKVTREGDSYRLSRGTGSSLIPGDEIAKVIYSATTADQLADKKLRAGDDPAALREVAGWAGTKGMKEEREHLIALARGIELDRRLAALEGTEKADPYLALARSMKADGGYTETERFAVLRRGLLLEPQNADVRLELGQVQREGRWVTLAQARDIDDAREARIMEARGLVKLDGNWVTPEEKERLLVARAEARAIAEQLRASEAERREAQRQQDALRADLARLEDERRAQDEAARQAQADATARAAADRQAAADQLAQVQAIRADLEYQRARARRTVIVTGYNQYVDPCPPRTVYQPRTVSRPCPPARPVYQPVVVVRPQPCPPTTTVVVRTAPVVVRTAPQRGPSASNPNLNWHPSWNKTGAPPMRPQQQPTTRQATVVVTKRR